MKRVWLDLHRWMGLKLSILISFVLITGTLATVSHEIDWLIDPARRVLPVHEAETYDWQGMADAARTARPDWSVEWIAAPLDPWFAAEAVALTDEGERRRLFIHPGTLAVQGEGGWFNAQRLFRDSHRRLMIFNAYGIILVSSLSILLIVSLISGLFVYKKFWRGFFKKPRTRDPRTLWGDLHRLGGVWSIWFIIVIALTGLWYLAEATGRLAGLTVGPFPEQTPYHDAATVQPVIPDFVSLNDMAASARGALPGYRIDQVFLPRYADEPVRFHGHTDAILVRGRGNAVSLDARTGRIVAIVDGHTLTVMQRISEMADPLHFGTFGGWPTKLLYFVFGIILSAMSLSGVYIFSARMRKAHQRREASAPRGAPMPEAAE